jgi:hypothetical protein
VRIVNECPDEREKKSGNHCNLICVRASTPVRLLALRLNRVVMLAKKKKRERERSCILRWRDCYHVMDTICVPYANGTSKNSDCPAEVGDKIPIDFVGGCVPFDNQRISLW